MKKDKQKYPPQIKILDIATIVSSILILTFMFYSIVLIRPAEPTVTLIMLGIGILVVIADLAVYFGFIRKKMIEKYAKI